MAEPLAGLKVLDLTRALAGPYCAMMLGDLGAEVIKIEMPGKGDDSRGWGPPFLGSESTYFLSVNRSKKSVTLNLKSQQGKNILQRLIEKADVLLENFSPGTMEKLGFPQAKIEQLNPRIVYCSISGFGQTGPYREKLAYDLILQGMGGLMSVTGPEGGPPIKVGVAIADLTAGMLAAFATLVALYHRERTGEGQTIDTSLLDGQVALLTFQAGAFLATGVPPGPVGNRHSMLAPYQPFQTKDGFLNVAVGNDAHWKKLCTAIDTEQLLDDPRFATNKDRLANRQELESILQSRTVQYSCAELLSILENADVPCGPIYNLEQVFNDLQIAHLNLIQPMAHPNLGEIRTTGIPYRFSKTPGKLSLPPPLLGQHTAEVLGELGLSPAEIAQLQREGVV